MLKVTGSGELQRALSDIARRVKKLDGKHDVPVTELLTPAFLCRRSRFQSVDEMFSASSFKIESTEDFDAIPGAAWDEFIRTNTSFASWSAMLGEASAEWASRKLGL